MLHDLSIVIICFNEENNLERLFTSIPKDAELIVVDSFSTDKSVEISKKFNATVYQRQFDNFESQKNFALDKANRKWTLVLDSDEQVTSRLIESLKNLISKDFDTLESAYSVSRKLVFMGREMKFGKTKDRPIRLLKTGKARFKGEIHEVLYPLDNTKVSDALRGYILHYSYADITDYFNRFNRYTSTIAENHKKNGKKANFILHTLRPWFEFVNRYFIRLGFVDGYEGYVYALFSSLYTFTKYAKYYELIRDDDK